MLHNIRKVVYSLYPQLHSCTNPLAKVALRRLDAALTASTGIISPVDPKAKELMQARDFALTILNNV